MVRIGGRDKELVFEIHCTIVDGGSIGVYIGLVLEEGFRAKYTSFTMSIVLSLYSGGEGRRLF